MIALVVLRKRRQVAKQKVVRSPSGPPIHDVDNLEHGRDELSQVQPPPYSEVLALCNGDDKSPSRQHNAPPHRHSPAKAGEVGEVYGGNIFPRLPQASLAGPVQPRDIFPRLPPAPLAGPVQPSTEDAANASVYCDAGCAGEGTADCSAEKSTDTTSTATASTVNISTHERAELAEFHRRQDVGNAASVASGPNPEQAYGGGSEASSSANRQTPAGDIGLRHAVLAAAQELARCCQVPGISEAAATLCIMANLVTDSRENDRACDSRLR